MSLLKKSYQFIKFPISDDLDPKKILDIYIKEFCPQGSLTFKTFVIIILNALDDFLSGKLDEKQIAVICHYTYILENTKKYHEKPYLSEHNSLLALISELADISWLQESKSYAEYKSELKDKYMKLIDFYDRYYQTQTNEMRE